MSSLPQTFGVHSYLLDGFFSIFGSQYKVLLDSLGDLFDVIFFCGVFAILSLPTRLIILAMGEVLRFGFNLAVLDPSDRKGNDTYCIVAIEDKKMGFISYCMSLSLYILSSCLNRYSVLMNLIL